MNCVYFQYNENCDWFYNRQVTIVACSWIDGILLINYNYNAVVTYIKSMHFQLYKVSSICKVPLMNLKPENMRTVGGDATSTSPFRNFLPPPTGNPPIFCWSLPCTVLYCGKA
jgi:hypothetical protein